VLAPEYNVQPGFSVRVIHAFVKAMLPSGLVSPHMMKFFSKIDPDSRFPAPVLLELLAQSVQVTGDPDLGLHAAEQINAGDYDLLEFLSVTSTSPREAISAINRYVRLLSDAVQVDLAERSGRAVWHYTSSLPLPRAANDFIVANMVLGSQRAYGRQAIDEVWLAHSQPADTREYQRILGVPVHFNVGVNAAVFAAVHLDRSSATANPKLNSVLRRHADLVLERLPSSRSLLEQVRARVARELATGNPTRAFVAAELEMSSRSLGRKLRREGTSFKQILDDVRRQLAVQYVRSSNEPISAISASLGFATPSAFHRAFRRWTGQTPAKFRNCNS
jgi:AraC-like DNA-binding protein